MMRSLCFKKWMFGVTAAAMLMPTWAHAYGESSVIQSYVHRDVSVPLIKPSWGDFLLHTDVLDQFYSVRSYNSIWVDSNGAPNAMAAALKNLFAQADQQGLNPEDYWDASMDKIYQSVLSNPKNWITFELAASESLIRYATHLSVGRFDPEDVDNDIKYKKKTFAAFNELNNAVQGSPANLISSVNQLGPHYPLYKRLVEALAHLKEIKANGGWTTLSSPANTLKRGSNNPLVSALRVRFNQLGYTVSLSGGSAFDTEFETALKSFQEKNGMTVTGTIPPRSELLRVLNYSIGQRISQVQVNMERLRWLPQDVESTHIFVNLALTEFHLYQDGQQMFDFRTVNGQPFRRTPSMKDAITFVDLNPTWTIPHSIAIKDKLPQLRIDPGYLRKHDMRLYDARTDREIDAESIDWRSVTPQNFNYFIRQNPGPDNALGVVKFPLQNPWEIYMHDTNERDLFPLAERHRSSGCVRLQQPLDLAAYLLRDNPEWSLQAIKDFVPMQRGQVVTEVEKKVFLKKAMPVYFMYLTTEKSEDGSIRFADDVYGQDMRLSKALQNNKPGDEVF